MFGDVQGFVDCRDEFGSSEVNFIIVFYCGAKSLETEMKATGRVIGCDSGKVGTDTRRSQPRRCDNGKAIVLNPGGVITSRKAVKPAESTQDRPRTHHRKQEGSTEDQPQQSKGIRRRSISQPQGPDGQALLQNNLIWLCPPCRVFSRSL